MSDPASKLIHRANQGDREAAVQLIEQFHSRIYAYLFRLTGNVSDAEDLTQQTFAQAWSSLGSFQERSSVSSWLLGIAHHVFYDWLRRRKPTESFDVDWWESCPDPFEAFTDLSQKDDAAAVWRSVERLSDDLRETVHLHYYQELTLQETADALGIAVSTVKHRIKTSIGRIQSMLSEPGMKAENHRPL